MLFGNDSMKKELEKKTSKKKEQEKTQHSKKKAVDKKTEQQKQYARRVKSAAEEERKKEARIEESLKEERATQARRAAALYEEEKKEEKQKVSGEAVTQEKKKRQEAQREQAIQDDLQKEREAAEEELKKAKELAAQLEQEYNTSIRIEEIALQERDEAEKILQDKKQEHEEAKKEYEQAREVVNEAEIAYRVAEADSRIRAEEEDNARLDFYQAIELESQQNEALEAAKYQEELAKDQAKKASEAAGFAMTQMHLIDQNLTKASTALDAQLAENKVDGSKFRTLMQEHGTAKDKTELKAQLKAQFEHVEDGQMDGLVRGYRQEQVMRKGLEVARDRVKNAEEEHSRAKEMVFEAQKQKEQQDIAHKVAIAASNAKRNDLSVAEGNAANAVTALKQAGVVLNEAKEGLANAAREMRVKAEEENNAQAQHSSLEKDYAQKQNDTRSAQQKMQDSKDNEKKAETKVSRVVTLQDEAKAAADKQEAQKEEQKEDKKEKKTPAPEPKPDSKNKGSDARQEKDLGVLSAMQHDLEKSAENLGTDRFAPSAGGARNLIEGVGNMAGAGFSKMLSLFSKPGNTPTPEEDLMNSGAGQEVEDKVAEEAVAAGADATFGPGAGKVLKETGIAKTVGKELSSQSKSMR